MFMQYLLFKPLQMVASYERRYEKTRAAMLGVTSSFDEQIEKITWVDILIKSFWQILLSILNYDEVETFLLSYLSRTILLRDSFLLC